MAEQASITLDTIKQILQSEQFELKMVEKLVLILLVLIGVLAFVSGISGEHAKHAWMAFQVNFTYWFAIAAAGSCFTAVFHICNAQWSLPIQRIFQSFLYFLTISPVFLIILYFGHHHLFSWSHEEIVGKGVWLTSNFLYSRDLLAIAVLIWLARKVICLSMGKDFRVLKAMGVAQLGEGNRYLQLAARAPASSENLGKQFADINCKLGFWSPIVVASYAVVMTLIAFDQIMSVDPHWYSTLFGALYFMSGVYLCMIWVSLFIGSFVRRHPVFRSMIQRKTLHDLGKLMFGFGIFWAYMFWSHYLTIWYGNIPEETAYIITRLREQPWHCFAWCVLGLSFIIPFFLGLSRDVKQVPILLFGTALIASLGIWGQQYLLFVPTLYPKNIPLSFLDIAITGGFLGLFVLCSASFLSRYPLFPLGDAYLDSQQNH